MVSKRPANHSKGDRSTRTAAIGSEITRFRVILGRSGCRTARSSQAQPPGPVRGVHQHIPRVHQTLVQPAQRRQVEQARSDARRERDRGPEIGFRKSHARHPESAFTQPVCHNKHVCRNPVQIERHFNRFSRSVRREAHQPSPVGPHAPGVVERKLGPAGARTTALGNRIPRGPVRTSRAPRVAQRFADVPIVRLKPFCNLSLSPAAVSTSTSCSRPH